MEHLLNTVHHADCFDLLAMIPDGAVDAIVTDLPYGTTACSWDTVIPFEPMWAAVKRVLKPRGVFVTTASQPFTSALVMSNPKWFKYSWVWDKRFAANVALAQYQPMKVHEDILLFCDGVAPYIPYMVKRDRPIRIGANKCQSLTSPMKRKAEYDSKVYELKYPESIITFSVRDDTGRQHPTQKPTDLFEYLIRTYTQPDELVLDFCAGSGTTAVAARNTGRRFIAGDSAAEYVAIARDRLRMPFEPRQVEPKSAPLEDLPLFAIGD